MIRSLLVPTDFSDNARKAVQYAAEIAEVNLVDLIAMVTQGATSLKEIFMGSAAAGTIGRTKIRIGCAGRVCF